MSMSMSMPMPMPMATILSLHKRRNRRATGGWGERRNGGTALGRGSRPEAVGGSAAGLVDFEGVDGPEGVGEGGGVVGHEVLAGVGLGGAGGGSPSVAGPVAAEGGVEDLVGMEWLVFF